MKVLIHRESLQLLRPTQLIKLFKFVFALSFIFAISCAQKPTTVGSRTSPLLPKGANKKNGTDGQKSTQWSNQNLELTKSTTILDGRSFFEYSSSHLFGSIRIAPEDFRISGTLEDGSVQKRLNEFARRLSRFGIHQDSMVLVVGSGITGEGEEGYLAWVLYLMGIEKVSFRPINAVKWPMSNQDTELKENVAPWEVVLNSASTSAHSSVYLSKNEFSKLVSSRTPYLNVPSDQTHDNAKHVIEKSASWTIIDVRSEKDFLKQPAPRELVGYNNALNVPWAQFFDSSGKSRSNIKNKLNSLGILDDQKIVVVSEDGISSAAVTMALLELGFNKASNLASGLKSFR